MTIHPFAIYVKGEEKVEEESFVVISENTKHGVNAVILFRNKLIEYIKNEYENRIKKIIYVSDGAGSQYKNKLNFLSLVLHYETHMGLNVSGIFLRVALEKVRATDLDELPSHPRHR